MAGACGSRIDTILKRPSVSILDAVLIRRLPYPYAERLVKAGAYDLMSGTLYGATSYPDFADWCEQNRFFERLAAYEDKTFNLAGTLQPEHVKGEVVSSDFFETLGVQPDQGAHLQVLGIGRRLY